MNLLIKQQLENLMKDKVSIENLTYFYDDNPDCSSIIEKHHFNLTSLDVYEQMPEYFKWIIEHPHHNQYDSNGWILFWQQLCEKENIFLVEKFVDALKTSTSEKALSSYFVGKLLPAIFNTKNTTLQETILSSCSLEHMLYNEAIEQNSIEKFNIVYPLWTNLYAQHKISQNAFLDQNASTFTKALNYGQLDFLHPFIDVNKKTIHYHLLCHHENKNTFYQDVINSIGLSYQFNSIQFLHDYLKLDLKETDWGERLLIAALNGGHKEKLKNAYEEGCRLYPSKATGLIDEKIQYRSYIWSDMDFGPTIAYLAPLFHQYESDSKELFLEELKSCRYDFYDYFKRTFSKLELMDKMQEELTSNNSPSSQSKL